MPTMFELTNGIAESTIPEPDTAPALALAQAQVTAPETAEWPVYLSEESDEPFYFEQYSTEPENKDNYSAMEVLGAAFRQKNTLYLINKASELNMFGADNELPTPVYWNTESDEPLYFDTSDVTDPDFDLSKSLKEFSIDENNPLFRDVKNETQFQSALQYYRQDEEDNRILNDTSLARRFVYEFVAQVPSPEVIASIATGYKWGTTAVQTAIEMGVIGVANESLRKSIYNENYEAEDIALDFIASGATGVLFTQGLKASSTIIGDFKNSLVEALRPNINRYFEMENGVLKEISTGKFSPLKQKAKRWVWEIFNNSPTYQMYNSGNPDLQKASGLIFRDRHFNLKGEEVVHLSNEETINLYESKYEEMASKIAEKRNLSPDKNIFDKELSNELNNLEVNIDTGEIYFGGKPKEEQLDLFRKKNMEPTVETKTPASDEFRFYDPELKQELQLEREYHNIQPSVNPHIRASAQAYIDFWRPIIKNAKASGRLGELFGEGGVKTDKKALTVELANMSPEKKLFAESSTNVVSLGHIIRHYNEDAIYSNMKEFRSLLFNYIYTNDKKLDPSSINKIIDKIIVNTLDANANVRRNAFKDLPPSVKFTKQREIAIQDNILHQSDLLKADVVSNDIKAWKPLLVEVELDRTARNLGYENWDKFRSNFSEKTEQALGAKLSESQLENPELIKEFNKEANSYNLQLLNDAEALLRGNFRKGDLFKNNKALGALAGAKSIAYSALSGMTFITNLTDVASIALKTGLSKRLASVLGNSLGRLKVDTASFMHSISSLPAVNRFVPDAFINKLNILKSKDPNGLRKALAFTDSMLKKTAYQDLGYNVEGSFANKVSEFTNKYTGINELNRLLKESVAEHEFSALIEECLKVKLFKDSKKIQVSKETSDFLKSRGLTPQDAVIISKAFRRRGHINEGLYYFPLEKLQNTHIEDTIRGVIRSLTEQTIQTPGLGDVPRYLRSDIGSFLFMFKTYPFLLYNNVVRHAFDNTTFSKSYVPIAITLAIFRENLANFINGQESDYESSKFWKSVANYSGLGVHILDLADSTERLLTSRKSAISQISPTLSFFDDIIDVTRSVIDPKKKINKRLIRNKIPIINSWYLRPLTNEMVNKNKRKVL